MGRTLDTIALHAERAEAVRKSDLSFGDVVIVRTRNSVYTLHALGDGTFAVSGGWFDARKDSPAMVTVQGCTYGGSVIRLDIVAARGLFLEFGNNVSTTRILEVGVVRHAAVTSDGLATALAC
jgi:hypothetical protein